MEGALSVNVAFCWFDRKLIARRLVLERLKRVSFERMGRFNREIEGDKTFEACYKITVCVDVFSEKADIGEGSINVLR